MGLSGLMHGTHHAGIERADDVLYGRWRGIAGRQADKRLFKRAGLIGSIAR